LPPSFDASKTRRYPILYYLHGLGDNEQTLVRSGGWDIIEHLRETHQIGEFLVVTPDAGHSFYINSRDGRERYEDFFIQEFIPAIEQRYRALGTRAGRGISGTSMGGYGALRFAFRYPNLFVSVSAHMAALAEELPDHLISGFGEGLDAFGQPFNAAFWKENTPYTLFRRSKGLGDLKIYFDCGEQDDFGFFAGARSLHELLQKRGVAHEYHLYPGRHNGEFVAAHFPASLRLHSRAFALNK
jgi:putative tributyrin esterase